MSLACSRSLFFMAFTAGAFALGASYYLEYVVGLTPCSLCLVQRLFLWPLMILCGYPIFGGLGAVARWLAEAIDSVLAQDYPNIELLVVDDASTDDTWHRLTNNQLSVTS